VERGYHRQAQKARRPLRRRKRTPELASLIFSQPAAMCLAETACRPASAVLLCSGVTIRDRFSHQRGNAMPLEQLANIAEVIGMLVVAITLIFFTAQMRQSTRATRSATAIQSTSTVTVWYQTLGNNEQSSALFYNALADPEAQSPEKWAQFVYLLHGLLLAFQNSFYLAREGTLDDRITHSLTEVIVAVKDQPGWQRFWSQRRTIFFPEFQDYLDETMSVDRPVSEGVYRNINPTMAPQPPS